MKKTIVFLFCHVSIVWISWIFYRIWKALPSDERFLKNGKLFGIAILSTCIFILYIGLLIHFRGISYMIVWANLAILDILLLVLYAFLPLPNDHTIRVAIWVLFYFVGFANLSNLPLMQIWIQDVFYANVVIFILIVICILISKRRKKSND